MSISLYYFKFKSIYFNVTYDNAFLNVGERADFDVRANFSSGVDVC